MAESKSRPHEWAPSARAAFLRTLDRIANEDLRTATLIAERVAHSIELVETNPAMGMPVQGGRVRRYPVPRTGHAFNYIDIQGVIRIVRWFRQRQDVKR
jgi:plasmid stabilization system protein ParE